MEASAGIPIKPATPKAERLSKRAAMAAGFVLLVLFGAIFYGVVSRSKSRAEAATGEKVPSAATRTGEEIARGIPQGSLGIAPVAAPVAAVPPDLRAPVAPDPSPFERSAPTREKPTPAEATLDEIERAEAYKLQREAMVAGMGVDGFSETAGEESQSLPGRAGAPSIGLQGANPASFGQANPDEYATQNGQSDKRSFGRSGKSNAYLDSTRVAALAKLELKAGWEIPAAMEQGLNSDLPGSLKALVTQDVYDTATGRNVLIPQGARLVGTYNSAVTYGQSRAQVVWNRIIYPDGSSLDLQGMVGQDTAGYAGFKDKVNNHYVRVFGAALVSSLFSAGYELTQDGNRDDEGRTSSSVVASAAGAEVSRVGAELTRRNLNVQPTIEIRPGYRFNVRVERDIIFPSAWRA